MKDIEIINRAETELNKFKHSDFLWCKHILGKDLRPHQEMWGFELDKYNDCLLLGSRRINKSWELAFKFLKWTSTDYPGVKANCFAPALEQSRRNLKYMTDLVMRSPILSAYLDKRLGKRGIGTDFIDFENQSEIRAKGEASSTDGLGSHIIWADEYDDMDINVFNERILGTGAEVPPHKDLKTTKVIRTGTIKGKGNIYKLETDEDMRKIVHILPKIDCYVGISLGIISEEYIKRMRTLLTKAQFKRMFLVEYTESENFYSTSLLNKATRNNISPIKVEAGKKFERPIGVRIGLGFDAAGKTKSSEDDEKKKRRSRANYAVTVVAELKPGVYQWLYSKEWDKGMKGSIIEDELINIWRFFQPDKGLGDAYNSDLIIRVNKFLYQEGLIKLNPDLFKDGPGENGWDGMVFSPIRFDGSTTHRMHLKFQKLLEDGGIYFPKIIYDDPNYKNLETLFNQIENIRSRHTSFDYDSYYCENTQLGDDICDSFISSLHALENKETKFLGNAAGGFFNRGMTSKVFSQINIGGSIFSNKR